jgi:NTP pyrophosphatase (non-canonical NTP hydrolase)
MLLDMHIQHPVDERPLQLRAQALEDVEAAARDLDPALEIQNAQGFADELADVTLYLLQIASLAEIDLEAAVMRKLEQNYRRTWDEKL